MAKALYIHVPFCKGICAYCDFTRCGYFRPLALKWIKRIKEDLKRLEKLQMDTIYIGGGTPSALDIDIFEELLCVLEPLASKHCEFTIEANVESLSYDKIKILNKYHVNRISLGVQSMQDCLLEIVERKHRKQDVVDTISLLKKTGITNISVDFIYGLPEQTMEMWEEDLKQFIQLDVPHISLYALTIEENSTFGRNGVQNMDSELESSMYTKAIEFLSKMGYEHYEISNFSKPGKASKHNIHYWHYDDFYGIGCGASGKENHIRYDITKNLHKYITEGECRSEIELEQKDEMFEMLMMSLRLKEGMSYALFEERFQVSFADVYSNPKEKMLKEGFLYEEKGYLKTTEKGMYLLNDVLINFLD